MGMTCERRRPLQSEAVVCIWRTVWSRITKLYADIHTELLYIHTWYDQPAASGRLWQAIKYCTEKRKTCAAGKVWSKSAIV